MYQLIGHSALRYFLEESGDEVVGVFTHQDDPEEEVWWPSVAELARRHGIPVYTPENINGPAWVQSLRELKPDFIVGAWYRRVVKRPVLEAASRCAVNLHGSLLPLYRGRAPINWVLVNGETQTGMTLHYMVEACDAGDILGQAVVPIYDDDTALTLYYRMAEAGRDVLRATWPLLREGKAESYPQDESAATHVGRRRPEDGRFSWEWPARRIHNLVRAVTHPYPGAFCDDWGRRLFVWASTPVAGMTYPVVAKPGTVTRVGDDGFVVATGEGGLLVRRAQYEGDEELSGARFAERYLRSSMAVVSRSVV